MTHTNDYKYLKQYFILKGKWYFLMQFNPTVRLINYIILSLSHLNELNNLLLLLNKKHVKNKFVYNQIMHKKYLNLNTIYYL